jgi:hypothetical protein
MRVPQSIVIVILSPDSSSLQYQEGNPDGLESRRELIERATIDLGSQRFPQAGTTKIRECLCIERQGVTANGLMQQRQQRTRHDTIGREHLRERGADTPPPMLPSSPCDLTLGQGRDE